MRDVMMEHEASAAGGGRSTPSAAATRLATPHLLSYEERRALGEASLASRSVRAGEELVREGEPAGSLYFLAQGWACRFKLHRDGRRQISTLLAPNDVCNLDTLLFGKLDYGVWMLTPGTVLSLPRDRALGLVADHPGIARNVTWLGFVENANLAQWTLCLGRKSARERVAHLLCELGSRLGCSDKGEIGFDLPLTQEHMADVLGLTPVHVNRTLQQFRSEGLLASTLRRIIVPDIVALRRIADFNPSYLHLNDAEARPAPSSIRLGTVQVAPRAAADRR